MIRYRWVVTSSKPCLGCLGRGGKVKTLEEWAEIGFPGDGETACGDNCLCYLEEVITAGAAAPGITHPPASGRVSNPPLQGAEASGITQAPAPALPAKITWVDLLPLLGTLNLLDAIERRRKDNSSEVEDQGSYQVQQDLGDEERVTLSMGRLQPGEAGKFEILAITAGVGNGWNFPAAVLADSLPLWNGAECFIDHSLDARKVKDLAGVLAAPAWDEQAQGVRVQLRALGPSGPVLEQIGRAVLAGEAEQLGFSTDVLFKAKDKTVTKIVKVLSVDLVYQPARGGKFVRALNQLEGSSMKKKKLIDGVLVEVEEESAVTELETEAAKLQSLLGAQQEQARLADEAKKAREIRAQMCEYLLTAGLSAAHLPAAAAENVRAQFAGKVFEAAELTAAIEAANKLVAALMAYETVQGPRIHGMFNSADALQAATDDLLGAPRDPDKVGVKPARLSGIRELYMTLTGDYELHGGYHGERQQFATTADFAGLVKNALNKIVVQKWGEMGRAGYTWWEKVATVEHFNSLNAITGTLIGTVGSLPSIAEGAEYTELAVGDSPETASFTKYGGYIPLTLELIDRDETRKLAAYPRELAIGGLRKVSELVAAIFTANAAVGPTLADTGALFNNTAVTTKGGHANLLTTALSAAQWEVVGAAVYNQPLLIKQDTGIYGTGPKMGLNPRFLLVPRALQLTGKKILYPSWENLANITSENQQAGQAGDVVTVPEWTDASDWAAVVDPLLAPAIFVGERFGIMPQVFIAGDDNSPAVFSNDESRLKVRHFLAVWVNDFRPLHKSNV